MPLNVAFLRQHFLRALADSSSEPSRTIRASCYLSGLANRDLRLRLRSSLPADAQPRCDRQDAPA